MNHRDTETQRRKKLKKRSELFVFFSSSLLLCVSVTLWFVFMVLRPHGADFLRVDAEFLDGLLYQPRLNDTAQGQLPQGGHGDALCIDLEVAAQGGPRGAAAEAVRAQHEQAARHPAANHLRHLPHVI